MRKDSFFYLTSALVDFTGQKHDLLRAELSSSLSYNAARARSAELNIAVTPLPTSRTTRRDEGEDGIGRFWRGVWWQFRVRVSICPSEGNLTVQFY